MYKSESIINNLLIEVDSLSYRITTIHQAYFNTSHLGLRERLFDEHKNILKRLIVINYLSLSLATFGLIIVLVGILLR